MEKHVGALERWSLQKDLVIDGTRLADGAGFARIAAISVDVRGRIAVVDAGDNRVIIFSPSGEIERIVGRKGAGPAEFSRPAAIAFVEGTDRILVRDEGNARVQLIDMGGAPVRALESYPLQGFSSGKSQPWFVSKDGTWFEEGSVLDQASRAVRVTRVHRSRTASMLSVDTIVTPDGASSGGVVVQNEQKDAQGKVIGISEQRIMQPFGSRWLRAFGPAGTRADVVTSAYRVRIYDANERLVHSVVRSVDPVAVSASERVQALKTLSKFGPQAPIVPKYKAPITAIGWSREGTLWIERAASEGAPKGVDVYNSVGVQLAVADAPESLDLSSGIFWINGTHVFFVVRDIDGLESVVRARINRQRR